MTTTPNHSVELTAIPKGRGRYGVLPSANAGQLEQIGRAGAGWRGLLRRRKFVGKLILALLTLIGAFFLAVATMAGGAAQAVTAYALRDRCVHAKEVYDTARAEKGDLREVALNDYLKQFPETCGYSAAAREMIETPEPIAVKPSRPKKHSAGNPVRIVGKAAVLDSAGFKLKLGQVVYFEVVAGWAQLRRDGVDYKARMGMGASFYIEAPRGVSTWQIVGSPDAVVKVLKVLQPD